MAKIVAIHQPNFFPWLGYFDKIARSDVFVFLDHVQLPKTGGSWSNRVKILNGGEARWVTAPIKRPNQGVTAINEIQLDDGQPWRKKLINLLRLNYSCCPYFLETFKLVELLINSSEINLAKFNMHVIRSLTNHIGLSCKNLVTSSDLSIAGSSNELLINIAKEMGGDIYMCGGGAVNYQDDFIFEKAGITVIYQDFDHPQYPQRGLDQFVSGLSIIDVLMNLGRENTANFFRQENVR